MKARRSLDEIVAIVRWSSLAQFKVEVQKFTWGDSPVAMKSRELLDAITEELAATAENELKEETK